MTPPRKRHWSPVELRYLREAGRRRISAQTIANRLTRTESCVRMKASKIGLSLDTREIRT